MKDMTWIDCHHHNPKAQTGGGRGSTQEPDQGMRPGAVEGSMLKPMEPSAAAALPVPSGRASQRGGQGKMLRKIVWQPTGLPTVGVRQPGGQRRSPKYL